MTATPSKNAKPRSSTISPISKRINLQLEVMDSTAVTLCMENKMPILVLNLWDDTALQRALVGKQVGTIVTGSAEY